MHWADALARNLAAAMLAGAWTEPGLRESAFRHLGNRSVRSQAALISRVLIAWQPSYPPDAPWLIRYFLQSRYFVSIARKQWKQNQPVNVVLEPPRFAPSPRFAGLDIPRLATAGELAAWLDISLEHLDWFADTRRQQGRTLIPDLQHYTYQFVAKASGPPRLIEAPKPRLKAMQRRILHAILDRLPAHESAHGFVRGRSCVSGAQAHAAEACVVTADLRDFFPSTPVQRVHGLFRQLGYPGPVARLLTGLATAATPREIFQRVPFERRHDWQTIKLFETPHLPQGAATSPALANHVAYGLDVRLSGLAAAYGAMYTRYADDLAFSGDEQFAFGAERFISTVAMIAVDEGYPLNPSKVRVMPRSSRQRVTGVVVNTHVNIGRAEFDQLKAILHNCARSGPASQNRTRHRDFQAHLTGRVGWVEHVNPARGTKLREMLERVEWA